MWIKIKKNISEVDSLFGSEIRDIDTKLCDNKELIRKLNKQATTRTEQIQAYLKEEQKLLNAYTELMSDNYKYSVDKVKSILSDVISFGKSNGAVPE